MKTLPVYLSIGYPTAKRRSAIQVEDDATPETIDAALQAWAESLIEIGYTRHGNNIITFLSIGYPRAAHSDEFPVDIDDSMTPEEIEAVCFSAASEWAWNYIDFGLI